jgi:6-phosphogluconate dehydrogenase, C-terminal domain
MMIGGEQETVQRLDPIFASLAPGIGSIGRTPGREKIQGTAEQGYLHCGSNGAGHFVKMIHNGIECGIMAAYAEGLDVLRAANVGTQAHEIDAETTPLRDPEYYGSDWRSCCCSSPPRCSWRMSSRSGPGRRSLRSPLSSPSPSSHPGCSPFRQHAVWSKRCPPAPTEIRSRT